MMYSSGERITKLGVIIPVIMHGDCRESIEGLVGRGSNDEVALLLQLPDGCAFLQQMSPVVKQEI